jgi:hypothetical protein
VGSSVIKSRLGECHIDGVEQHKLHHNLPT